MKIAITGANGFIGQALVAHLQAAGHEPIPIFRRASGLACERVIGDIDGTTDWSLALAGAEAVVHLAARVQASHNRREDTLAEFRKVNLHGTRALAVNAAECGVRRFVFVSTIKVNGEKSRPGKPFCADDAPKPEEPYAISKAEAEAALQEVAAGSMMDYVIIRPPLVYGLGAKGNLRSIANWILRGLPIPLASVTHNRRSLVGIDNLVDLIVHSLEHPAAANGIFTVADGEDLSTAEMVRRLAAVMNRQAKLVPAPPALLYAIARLIGATSYIDRLLGSLQVDFTKTCEQLEWTPPVSVSVGFRNAFFDHDIRAS